MTFIKIQAPVIALLCAVGATTPGLGSDPAAAQASNSGDQSPDVCMVRPSAGDGQPETKVIAPRAALGFLESKGFSEFVCGSNGFGTAEQIEFRDFVCRLAADQPEGVQEQYEQSLGARPATLCGLAEVALGPWNADEGSSQ